MVEMQSACPLQQRIDVEALLEHGRRRRAALGRDAQLAHPAQERVFVAEEPDAQRAARKILGARHAGSLQAGQHHARTLEGLGDVDQRQAAFARGQRGGHPFDDHVGAAARDHLRGAMSGPPGLIVTSRPSSS
jgi:hypothetical protein